MATDARSVLEDMGIEFHNEPGFPLASIKIAPTDSQIRTATHIAPEKRVKEYARQMMNPNSNFPPVVIDMRTGELVDGYTRVEAAKRNKLLVIDAITANFPSLELRWLFAARLNQSSGERLTPTEAKKVALQLIHKGYEESTISFHIGVSQGEARKWRDEYEAERKLEHHLDERQKAHLVGSHLSRLNQIRYGTPVMIEAAKLIADAGMDTKSASTLVITGCNRQDSQDDALAYIAHLRGSQEIKAEIAKRKSGQIRKMSQQSAPAAIRMAATLLRKRTIEEYRQEVNGDADDDLLEDLRYIYSLTGKLVTELGVTR